MFLVGNCTNPQTPQQKPIPKPPVLKTRMKPFGSAKHNQTNIATPLAAQLAKKAAKTAMKPKTVKERPPPKLLPVQEESEAGNLSHAKLGSEDGSVSQSLTPSGFGKVMQNTLKTTVPGISANLALPAVGNAKKAFPQLDRPAADQEQLSAKRADNKMKDQTGIHHNAARGKTAFSFAHRHLTFWTFSSYSRSPSGEIYEIRSS